MRITRQTIYGLACLLSVARKERPVTLGEISKEQEISKDYVERLLMRFKRENLVKSIRGVKGGYILAKNAKSITLKDVIVAQEKDVLDTICFKKDLRCKSFSKCDIKPVWLNLKRKIEESLEKLNLAMLLETKGGICR